MARRPPSPLTQAAIVGACPPPPQPSPEGGGSDTGTRITPSPAGGGLGWGPDALPYALAQARQTVDAATPVQTLLQILNMGEQQINLGRTLSATQVVARIRQRILQN